MTNYCYKFFIIKKVVQYYRYTSCKANLINQNNYYFDFKVIDIQFTI